MGIGRLHLPVHDCAVAAGFVLGPSQHFNIVGIQLVQALLPATDISPIMGGGKPLPTVDTTPVNANEDLFFGRHCYL